MWLTGKFQSSFFPELAGCWLYPAEKHKDRDQKVEVLYGYPANSTTWLTIYHYRKSGRWVFEWDDLFAEKRPKSWGDISECMMFEERKSGATREEFNEAWARLSERGYL